MNGPGSFYLSRRCCGGETHRDAGCRPGSQGLYTVQRGDTLFAIAWRFQVSPNALIAANPNVLRWSPILPGEVLCIPAAGS
ncbi:MAG: LysM domain-containing protein [Bacillota bacterium]